MKKTVKMKNKDGKIFNVAEDCVQKFKKLGYTEVKGRARANANTGNNADEQADDTTPEE